MFEKLMFWKKEEPDLGMLGEEAPMFGEESKFQGLEPKDELGLPKEKEPTFGAAPPMPGIEHTEESAFGASQSERPEAFQPVQQQSPVSITPDMLSKDLQIISSKLDTVKAQLENMSQRIANIEKKAYEGERQEGW